MKSVFFILIASLTISAQAASTIVCEPPWTEDFEIPELSFDIVKNLIHLNGSFSGHNTASLQGDFHAGTYENLYKNHGNPNATFTLDMGNERLWYPCNHMGTYLIFSPATSLLKVNVNCDGASPFTIYSTVLKCVSN